MSRKNDRSLRVEFEAFYLSLYPNHSVEHATDGGYKHNNVEIAWAAYKRAHKDSLKEFKRGKHTFDVVKRSYVVGTLTQGWKPSFSNYPRVHKTFEEAEKEAQRLANLLSKDFCVTGILKKIQPQTPEEILEERGSPVQVGEAYDFLTQQPTTIKPV